MWIEDLFWLGVAAVAGWVVFGVIGVTVPFWIWILIGVAIYMFLGWATVGIYSNTKQGREFNDDELFGLGIVWPLVALKGLLYVIFRSGRGSLAAVIKLFSNW
jgi:hypothetical protein